MCTSVCMTTVSGLYDYCLYSYANLGSQWVALFGEGLGGVPLSEDVTGRCLLVFKVHAIST